MVIVSTCSSDVKLDLTFGQVRQIKHFNVGLIRGNCQPVPIWRVSGVSSSAFRVPYQALDQLLVCKQSVDQGQMRCRHDMNSSVTTHQAQWIVICVLLQMNSHVPQTNYSISKNKDFVS
jgi:hypothetical protein